MANNQSALLALLGVLQQAEGGDVMRQLLGSALQDLIEAEAAAHIGAAKHERTPERTAQRNGTRQKLVSTTAGDITVKIPKTRTVLRSEERRVGKEWRPGRRPPQD